MIDVAFAIPGVLDAPTGGYAYARRMLQHLPEHGVMAHHIALPGSFPDPIQQDLEITRHLLAQIDPATPILFDGLAFGALPPEIATAVASPIVALVHHPLALETGLTSQRRRYFQASERFALQQAAAVIASSPLTARTLIRDYAVDAERLSVAEPGTVPALRAIGTGKPFAMLAVGTVIPRKGYPVLIDALEALAAKRDAAPDNWHLTIVGSTERSPDEANLVRERILQSGLRRNITIAGEVSTRLCPVVSRKPVDEGPPSVWKVASTVTAARVFSTMRIDETPETELAVRGIDIRIARGFAPAAVS